LGKRLLLIAADRSAKETRAAPQEQPFLLAHISFLLMYVSGVIVWQSIC